jgi:hypothetical protein
LCCQWVYRAIHRQHLVAIPCYQVFILIEHYTPPLVLPREVNAPLLRTPATVCDRSVKLVFKHRGGRLGREFQDCSRAAGWWCLWATSWADTAVLLLAT